ncbi:hypothetical protein GPJ59_25070 [Streptomyces bambusae]|uniref:Uncharacterized protein n=2 Tax=Streptomyces bambusae TaxID=1550616 RepID=A0ABS6ZEI2_9ACTN|nr:hypothetical protein [Streptomyces bambusae]
MQKIDRPGRPENLPSAEVLWARWALVAVLEASAAKETESGYRAGTWVDDEGLHLDDGGCTWWTFSPMGDGRYVLYGEDESSAVKWHEPAVDMLAGGPDWLPYDELRDRLQGWELGCVYWYENGAWARAPYPDGLDDDGLDCGMSRFVVRGEALALLAEARRERSTADAAVTVADLMAAAEAYRLAPELLAAFTEGSEAGTRELPAMGRSLALAGLVGPAAEPAAVAAPAASASASAQ